jgi:methyl-accepting chemotaxis protein
LTEIVKAVEDVTSLVADISGASTQQASGIQQVNATIASMDELTQRNAALVEEATASSRVMEDQAAGLMRLMTFFNTGDNDSYQGATTSAHAPQATPQLAKPSQAATASGKPANGNGGASGFASLSNETAQEGQWAEF